MNWAAMPPVSATAPVKHRSSRWPRRCCATTGNSRRNWTRKGCSTRAGCTRSSSMQTTLSEQSRKLPRAAEAEKILRTCVHCGFCNATCPTYQLLGDELDGPRGRIYLIKQVLEGAEVTRSTQLHLDRCLTCLNCQTTCPSGVEYGHLLDIGRKIVDAKVTRPPLERGARWVLR